MSSNAQGRTLSWGAVAAAQLRMVALLQRRDFLVFAGIGAVILGLALYGLVEIAKTPPPRPPDALDLFEGLKAAFALVGALWPLGVWRRDSPDQRGYFWSLPVARGPHTLLRVATGWLLLMSACVAAMLVGTVVAQLYAMQLDTVVRFSGWYVPLASATLGYLLISVFAVLVDSPVRWVVWTVVALFGLRVILDATDLEALWRPIESALRSLAIALDGPQPPRIAERYGGWGLHYPLWFAVAALGVIVGAYRHRDAK